MANGSTPKKTDPKAWVQELKTNRQTQGALLAFVVVLTWLLWPEPPKKPRLNATAPGRKSVGLDPKQLADLKKLPDLAKLDRARQLPDEEKINRDLFLFDGEPWNPPPPPKPKEKPLTPEQLEAKNKAEEAARLEAIHQGEVNLEMSHRPSTLRYLGYIESPSVGMIGGFLKGEIPEQHKPGELVGKGWKLVKLTEKKAEFQNLKFLDLKFSLEAKDSSGPSLGPAVSNEF